ncbi:hypothetical protein ACF068_00540 [Streptomyces sp. NPDC016309]|uniref:hypothetical protein n=1 Tax=Streptomyces sp. NPDC016309 TaxID=3364965 RepID=UPI0036F55722
MTDLPAQTLLVFDRDDWVYVLPSFDAAAHELEAVDVAGGEYEAFTLDGERVALTAPGGWRGPVVVGPTGRRDPEALRERIERSSGSPAPTPEELARLHLNR